MGAPSDIGVCLRIAHASVSDHNRGHHGGGALFAVCHLWDTVGAGGVVCQNPWQMDG